MFEDTQDSAVDQLKRADHLLHITLKYSKTGDVMKSIIKRLLGAMDSGLDEALEFAKKKKLVKNIPKDFKEKIIMIQAVFPQAKNVREYVILHNNLKSLNKASYFVKEEYRKNITLVTDAGDIKTERLVDFYEKAKEMVTDLEKWKRRNK